MLPFVVATSFVIAGALVTHNTSHGSDVERASTLSFCMDGHLAPTFFLLGTPKSGTTFFYQDFARSPQIIEYQPLDGQPSWRSKEPWEFTSTFNVKYRDQWLAHYPECPKEEHLVGVDCTPGYFGSKIAPEAIHTAYGDARNNLVFMVFLREPVARAHSHYYQYQENGVLQGYFAGCTPEQFPKTFAVAVENLLSMNAACNCDCDDIFSDSMYMASFERYFHYFGSSGFHVVPFKQAVRPEVVAFTFQLLNVERGDGEKILLAGEDNEMNHHVYPEFHQEMSASLMSNFEQFMHKAAGSRPVAELLARSGAHLYGHGESRSVDSIASWLEENW